jgi:NADPH-dependent 2,4-dienoyl-CoA reductase/sulfur reductase-like enzyme
MQPAALISSRQRLHRIRAGQVILATGALARIPVFANNDRPGVMLASSVSTYITRYAVAPGQRMVLFACADAAYQTALDWLDAGLEVVAVIDPRGPDAGFTCLDLRGDSESPEFCQIVQQTLRVALPTIPNTRTHNNDGTMLFWLGLDQWFVLIPGYDNENDSQSYEARMQASRLPQGMSYRSYLFVWASFHNATAMAVPNLTR